MSLGLVASDQSKTNSAVSQILTAGQLVAATVETNILSATDAYVDTLVTGTTIIVNNLEQVPIDISNTTANITILSNVSSFQPASFTVQLQAVANVAAPSDLPKYATILLGQVDVTYAPPIDQFLTVFVGLTTFISLWLKTTGEIYAVRLSDDIPGSIPVPIQFSYIIN